MAYRVIIQPKTDDASRLVVIQDEFGEDLAWGTDPELAIAWLVDHGCWPREAAHVRTFQPDTVYWITADRPGAVADDAS